MCSLFCSDPFAANYYIHTSFLLLDLSLWRILWHLNHGSMMNIVSLNLPIISSLSLFFLVQPGKALES
jgi:hypothetical protein